MSNRSLRVCEACGGVDDHPRHIHAALNSADQAVNHDLVRSVLKMNLAEGDETRILNDLYDQSSITLHMDCCAMRGCPTGACGATLAENGGRTREALVQYVEKRAVALDKDRES
jgi:hypothetical protein